MSRNRDFESSRSSESLARQCSGASALRIDAAACRGYALKSRFKRLRTFALNSLDFALYEKLHRDFCSRLDQAGIRTEPQVQVDLERSRFCGDLKFDNVEDVCGRLDHPDVLAKLKDLRQNQRIFGMSANIRQKT